MLRVLSNKTKMVGDSIFIKVRCYIQFCPFMNTRRKFYKAKFSNALFSSFKSLLDLNLMFKNNHQPE